jgi:shikimate kinase
MIIFFIGLPGSGKTTVGKKFADKLDVPFIDLDDMIEKSEKMKISEIFEKKGEEYFRQVEHNKLRSLEYLDDKLVVSTGGGTPCFMDNINLMRKMGTIIYLNPPIETIVDRLSGDQSRPLLMGNVRDTINKLYCERKTYYEQADFKFITPEVDLNKLHHWLRNQL